MSLLLIVIEARAVTSLDRESLPRAVRDFTAKGLIYYRHVIIGIFAGIPTLMTCTKTEMLLLLMPYLSLIVGGSVDAVLSNSGAR
ncbi:hypothetical protein DFS33DRAFT_1321901 [Desarmillaria ectypa]|nr:hypothetical protein DFS33DRAFT_1321901 [Desarmillaria ectypa]